MLYAECNSTSNNVSLKMINVDSKTKSTIAENFTNQDNFGFPTGDVAISQDGKYIYYLFYDPISKKFLLGRGDIFLSGGRGQCQRGLVGVGEPGRKRKVRASLPSL